MLLELAKPITLLACILSLLGLFHAAFLEPAADPLQHLEDALGPLLMAGALALLDGLMFLPGPEIPGVKTPLSEQMWVLLRTFPVRVFCWATSGMAAFFLVAWYLEAHCIFYRDVRY
jgi:hypothetical protein